MFKLTAQEVANRIDWPLETWPGNCYAVACAMLEAKIVRGKATYGHYFGFISPDSDPFGGRTVTHHGWIRRKTTLVDPTRWVFEAVEPYIYVGPVDDPDYDAGSNRLRKILMKPPPPFDDQYKTYEIPKHLRLFALTMLDHYDGIVICGPQVMWLANLPLDMLGDMAEPVFKWIADDVGIPGFIPIDNRMEILGR